MKFAKLFGVISLLLTGAWASAESASDLRATMFREADQALAAANAVKASIYAPVSYAAGAESYRDADSPTASRRAIHRPRRSLPEATEA